MTSWLAAARPSLSANLHGGALVASFALDACDSLVRVWWGTRCTEHSAAHFCHAAGSRMRQKAVRTTPRRGTGHQGMRTLSEAPLVAVPCPAGQIHTVPRKLDTGGVVRPGRMRQLGMCVWRGTSCTERRARYGTVHHCCAAGSRMRQHAVCTTRSWRTDHRGTRMLSRPSVLCPVNSSRHGPTRHRKLGNRLNLCKRP